MGLHTQFTNAAGYQSDDLRPCGHYTAMFDALRSIGHGDVASVIESFDQEEKIEIPPSLRAAWIRASQVLASIPDDAPNGWVKEMVGEITSQMEQATHMELWF